MPSDTDGAAELRRMDPAKLHAEVLVQRWYVHPDDEVDGWCVMPADAPPSSGLPRVARTATRVMAEWIADLHNEHIGLPA